MDINAKITPMPQRAQRETRNKKAGRVIPPQTTNNDVLKPVRNSSLVAHVSLTEEPGKKTQRRKRSGKREVREDPSPERELRKEFQESFLYPDITGPMKYPALGGSEVSTIGIDHTVVYLTGKAVDNTWSPSVTGFLGVQGTYYGSYTRGTQKVNTLAGTTIGWADVTANGFATVTDQAASIQFPPTSSVTEALLTSGCMTIEYLGSVNAACGEIMVGTYMSDFGVTSGSPTYASASYASTSITYPVSKLLQDGIIRVPLVHNGPVSWQYLGINASPGDYNLPFMAFTGLPSDGTLKVQIYRNWEIKSPLTSTGIPYESRTGSTHKDIDALQDSIGDLGRDLLSLVTFGWPKMSDLLSNGVAKQVASMAASSLLSSGARMLLNKNLERVQKVSFIHPKLLEMRAKEVENNRQEESSQTAPVSNQSSPINVPISNNNNSVVNVPTQGAPGPANGWFSPSFGRATDRQ